MVPSDETLEQELETLCLALCFGGSRQGTKSWEGTMTEEKKPAAKPVVKLTDQDDGDAYAIMGRCAWAMRKAKWSKKRCAAVLSEMKEGSYDHLLVTVARYFDVE